MPGGREVNRCRRGHVIAAGGRRDHERIQADLCEHDEIVEPGVRAWQCEVASRVRYFAGAVTW